jgi:3-polyprenyl-4-hydroxybenzoate decarboxylase
MFKDLHDFIAALERERELARVVDPVSPDLEICAVTDRVSKSPGGGPGLLFERPTGFSMPVAINLFGSMKRMCMALGVGEGAGVVGVVGVEGGEGEPPPHEAHRSSAANDGSRELTRMTADTL